jgi:acyl carrier protein phosphodiesterase
MNLLAHALLSDPDPLVLLGNLMADTVKGRAGLEDLPPRVRAGVLQHRFVDKFTDEHPYCIAGCGTLVSIRPLLRAPVFDILMDILLARSWDHFTDEPLEDFAERARLVVEDHAHLHTPRFELLAHRIIHDGALHKATTHEGLRFLLQRIGDRWGNSAMLLPALEDFEPLEDDLLPGFLSFFSEMRAAARADFEAHR